MNETNAICDTVRAFEQPFWTAAASLAGLRQHDAREALQAILMETGERPGPTVGDAAEALLRRHMTTFLASRRRWDEQRAAEASTPANFEPGNCD